MPLLLFGLLTLTTKVWKTVASPSPSPVSSSNVPPVPLYDEDDYALPSSTAKPAATNTESSNYLTRLDFISVIVICAIVAFCFGICVVIGCRRKKHRPTTHDFTDSLPHSFTDSRSEPRVTNLAYSPSDLRVPESPPPTYSIIERQTSFTSYVSQTSSQYEIPPDYDEALSFGDAANGESFANRLSRPSSVNGSERSSGRFFFPTKGGAVAARSKRSESARTRGPPRARSHRSSSDAGRARRARLSSRPATVSEDDSSQCSMAASAVTPVPSDHEMAHDGASSHTISVRAEVASTSRTRVSASENNSDGELARPLLPPTTGSEFADNDVSSESNVEKNEGAVTRKLTLV